MALETIKKLLANYKHIDESLITRETTFESIGIDSLDTVDLVIDLEEAFPAKIRITVDETEMPHEHMTLSGNATSVVKRIAAAGIGCEVIFYIPIGCELHAGLTLHDTSAEQYGIGDAAESE